MHRSSKGMQGAILAFYFCIVRGVSLELIGANKALLVLTLLTKVFRLNSSRYSVRWITSIREWLLIRCSSIAARRLYPFSFSPASIHPSVSSLILLCHHPKPISSRAASVLTVLTILPFRRRWPHSLDHLLHELRSDDLPTLPHAQRHIAQQRRVTDV